MGVTKYFVQTFANSGDKTPIPDTFTGDNSVSYQAGFTDAYELPLTDPASFPVPRDQFNELMYDVTIGIQQYQQWGVPNFISTSDNDGTPFQYSLYAYCLYDDGVNGPRIFQSLKNNNTSLPTVVSDWRWLDPSAIFFPPGMVAHFAMSTPPTGWLSCDHQEVSRTTYAALFAAIGVTWGIGNGTTTFNLPPQARSGIIGVGGTASPVIGNTVGSTGGVENHTLTVGQIPNKTVNVSGVVNIPSPTGSGAAVFSFVRSLGLSNILVPVSFAASGSTTGFDGTPVNLYSPETVMLRCIKY